MLEVAGSVLGVMPPGGMGVLGEGFVLVSPWKPFLLMLPIIPWAWLISKVFDKHAAQYFLPRKTWGFIHLIVGSVALLAGFLIPVAGLAGVFAGLGVMTVLLALDITAFVVIANRDDRVPERHRLRLDFSKIAAARAARTAKSKAGNAELIVTGPGKKLMPVPEKESPLFEVRLAAEQALIRGLDARANQIELVPAGKDNAYVVLYHIDGMRQAGQTLPGPAAVQIMDFWKTAAQMDVNERRKKVVGEASAIRGQTTSKLLLTSISVQGGMKLSLLVNPEDQVRRKPTDLGLLEPQLNELKAIIEERMGVVLLAAPADQGRTTTMYAILKMHDPYTQNVQTVETDIQDALEGMRQNKFDPQAEATEHSTLVRSIIRRDPQVLGVADLLDAATAKEVARVDSERTRVYVSIRADSAMAALQIWCQLVGDPEVAAKVLHGVIAQKLMRKLCINCRLAYSPQPDMLTKLNLPKDKIKQLFKKGGQVLIKNKPEVCPVCQGAGFLGQDGVFEVYNLGSAERQLIASKNFNGLKAELRKKQLPTIQQAALKKAVDGFTSIEEVLRITAESQPAAPAPAQPKPAPAGA